MYRIAVSLVLVVLSFTAVFANVPTRPALVMASVSDPDADNPAFKDFQAKIAEIDRDRHGKIMPAEVIVAGIAPAAITVTTDPNNTADITAHLVTNKAMHGLVGGKIINIATRESMSLPTYEFDTTSIEPYQVTVLQRLWKGEIPWRGLMYFEGYIATTEIGFTVVRRLIDPNRGAIDELSFDLQPEGVDTVKVYGNFSADAVAFFGFSPLQIVARGPGFMVLQSPFLAFSESRITVCDASRCGDQPFKAKGFNAKG